MAGKLLKQKHFQPFEMPLLIQGRGKMFDSKLVSYFQMAG